MPAMQRVALGVLVLGLLSACGPSMEADHVKTPDELIAEQEQAGAEQMQRQKNADEVGLSQVQVSRLLSASLAKMRDRLEAA